MNESRKLYATSLRSLCINRRWYTRGTCEQYDNLLTMVDKIPNMSTSDIVKVAQDIIDHSDLTGTDYNLACVCFEVARVCETFFAE